LRPAYSNLNTTGNGAARPPCSCFITPVRTTALAILLLAFALAVAGCGGEDEARAPVTTAETARATATKTSRSADADPTALARRPPGSAGLRVPAKRARMLAKSSDFGRVLFDANGQVVYAFEIDRKNGSNCTSADCVKAWPPVLTREPPSAGAGLNEGLLGTIRRSDGKLQVTYNGRPLYFYEHEGPGEIKCHNVDLHGGRWWVVTARGEPAE
jgi:predicted lipoprotein with Yx(FWY)xxD motif